MFFFSLSQAPNNWTLQERWNKNMRHNVTRDPANAVLLWTFTIATKSPQILGLDSSNIYILLSTWAASGCSYCHHQGKAERGREGGVDKAHTAPKPWWHVKLLPGCGVPHHHSCPVGPSMTHKSPKSNDQGSLLRQQDSSKSGQHASA